MPIRRRQRPGLAAGAALAVVLAPAAVTSVASATAIASGVPAQSGASAPRRADASARQVPAPPPDSRPASPPQPPDTGLDGILVVATGTVLAAGGWLLMIAASRRLRGRSR